MVARRFDGPCNGSKRSSTFLLSQDFSASPHIGQTAVSTDRSIRKTISHSKCPAKRPAKCPDRAETPFVLNERTGDNIIRQMAD
jgi:hypothetical protein